MKKIIGLTIIVSVLLLSACSSEKEAKSEPKEIVAHEVENNKVVNEKEWKDVTELEEGKIYDMETNVKDYIAGANRIFHEVPDQDSKLIQAGHDEAYYYYMEAMALDRGLDVVQVKGVSLEKDFDNLQKLVGIIEEGHHKRTEHIDPEKYGANKREAVKDWEEPSKRMNQAIEYTK